MQSWTDPVQVNVNVPPAPSPGLRQGVDGDDRGAGDGRRGSVAAITTASSPVPPTA